MAPRNCVLITSDLCYHSRKVRAWCRYLKVETDERKVEFENTTTIRRLVPGSTYGTTPILVTDDHIIEDWRAILRFIDTTWCGQQLERISPKERCALFEQLEWIDRNILAVLNAALILDPTEGLSSYSWQHALRRKERYRHTVEIDFEDDFPRTLEQALRFVEARTSAPDISSLPERLCDIAIYSSLDPFFERDHWRETSARYPDLTKWLEQHSQTIAS